MEWNLTKDDYLQPVVYFEPIEMNGVTIEKATGFNGKFIRTNKIGPGSIIVIIRSGDVIPHIEEVLKESETANFIICYGGGIGTTHELFSILTNYYDKVHLMPCILFCDVDAQDLIEKIYSLLNSWDIPKRPYIKQLISKIKVHKVDDICQILKSKTKRKNNLIY